MSPRKALLGILGVFAMAGMVAGGPPASPLVEGREPNPVDRDFYQSEKPLGGYVATGAARDESSLDGPRAFPAGLWELLLDQLTFPLGTAAMNEPDQVGGA